MSTTQAFSPGLINYLLFPLTQILRGGATHPAGLPPMFLETAFRFLAFVLDRWKVAETGMDIAAWEQLWRFVIASATPMASSSGTAGSGKGKEKATEDHVAQEVHLERVRVLSTLLMSPRDHPTSVSYPT